MPGGKCPGVWKPDRESLTSVREWDQGYASVDFRSHCDWPKLRPFRGAVMVVSDCTCLFNQSACWLAASLPASRCLKPAAIHILATALRCDATSILGLTRYRAGRHVKFQIDKGPACDRGQMLRDPLSLGNELSY